MNQMIRTQWLAALRGGAFTQGTGRLRTDVEVNMLHRSIVIAMFCCLGVLCELHRIATGKGEWVRHDGEWAYHATGEDGIVHSSSTALPHPVKAWAGLAKQIPIVKADKIVADGLDCSLAQLNDGNFGPRPGLERGSCNFNEIAEIIETEVK